MSSVNASPPPAVSVVIPLYNKAPHIKRTLASVFCQSFQDFQIIVVDDGSTDGGAEIVEAVNDPRLTLVRQKNQGVSIARNVGIQHASAQLIAFLDADDEFTEHYLSTIIELNTRFPDAIGYALNYVYVSSEGRETVAIDSVEASCSLDLPGFLSLAKKQTPIFTSSFTAKRTGLIEAGGFPAGVKLGEDLDTWIRLLMIGNVIFCPEVGARYHQEAVNRACVKNPPPLTYIFQSTIAEWTQNRPLDPETKRDIEEFNYQFTLAHCHYQIRYGNRARGLHLLLQCKTKTHRRTKYALLMKCLIPRSTLETMSRLKKKAVRQE